MNDPVFKTASLYSNPIFIKGPSSKIQASGTDFSKSESCLCPFVDG
jgi:hypothetical protein